MRLWLFLGLLLILSGLPAMAAPAQASAATEQVQARLLTDHQVVSPGQRLRVALQQKIIPQWHTYWQNPGDSGEATQIHWQLPAGVTMSALEWPAPQRFVVGPITNYGYSDEVSLLQWLSLPADWPAGQLLQLSARVDWLVCAEECIPQSVQLALTVPVAQSPVPASAEDLAVIHASEARLPQALPFQSQLAPAPEGGYQLLVSGLPAGVTLTDSYFFAGRWGLLAQSQPQRWQLQQGALRLHLPAGDNPLNSGDTLDGVLLLHEDGVASARGYQLSLAMAAAPAGGTSSATGALLADPAPAGSGLSVVMAVVLAFAGGFLLNLMPCVFPVLSMKALALLAHREHPLSVQRRHGWAYTSGIVVSFIGFALLLLGFKAAGTELGWGFQFQSPLFVLLMTCLLFAVGLNLSGVFEISGRFNGTGQQLAAQQGYRGSFFTGVLATVVATPCTAPLMAAALGFAMTQPALPLLLVFVSLGLGLASPVLLLSYWPALQRRLPKPGPWMLVFRQLLAFPMYGAAIWLAWVLAQLQGADSWWWLLVLLLLQSFALWWLGLSQQRVGARWQPIAALLVLMLALSWGIWQLNAAARAPAASPAKAAVVPLGPEFEPYSDARLAELRAAGTPVFVNFTAAWCLSCLVNEKVALNTTPVKQAFKAQRVVYLKADWTARDDQIRQTLARYGRSGVPLYLFFPAGQRQVVELPQILTPDLLVRTVSSVH
jgi:thiol:disulfide interchange protein/DsbC/DsbD-like thiol-disulfide interchange protein